MVVHFPDYVVYVRRQTRMLLCQKRFNDNCCGDQNGYSAVHFGDESSRAWVVVDWTEDCFCSEYIPMINLLYYSNMNSMYLQSCSLLFKLKIPVLGNSEMF